MPLTQHSTIMRCLAFVLLWACICCHTRGEEGLGGTFVFFVQNTDYSGGADLSNKTNYNRLVNNLYEVFENYMNNPVPLEDRNDNVCQRSRNETKEELLNSFRSFVGYNRGGLVEKDSKLFIVLNGHGVQIKPSQTYAFRVQEEYVPLYDFAECLKKEGLNMEDLNVIFLVLTCRTPTEPKLKGDTERLHYQDIAQAFPELQHVIIYACGEGAEVVVDESVTLNCLIDALSGAADAELAIDPDRDGFHDGQVSLLEVWRYIDWQSKQMNSNYTGECIPYCEGDSHNQTTWFSAVTKLRRAFLKPSTFIPTVDNPELLAIGDVSVDIDDGSVPYPKYLPKQYRYNFDKTSFNYGTCRYCYFKKVDFSNAQFQPGALRGTTFEKCSLLGATIGGIALEDASEKEGFKIER